MAQARETSETLFHPHGFPVEISGTEEKVEGRKAELLARGYTEDGEVGDRTGTVKGRRSRTVSQAKKLAETRQAEGDDEE